MKNILYLFFAITLLSCGSDEANAPDDNITKTFLEKYEDVVFECQNCPFQSDYSNPLYIGFTPSTNFYYYNWDLFGCGYLFEGDLNGLNDDWGTLVISNNSSNNLTFTKTYSDGIETYSFSTNGTSLILEVNWVDGETVSFNYLTTDLVVNDICN